MLTRTRIELNYVIFFTLLREFFTWVGHNEGDLWKLNASRKLLVKLWSLGLGKHQAYIMDHLTLLTLFWLLLLDRSHELCNHLGVFLDFGLLGVSRLHRLTLSWFVLLLKVFGLVILVAALLKVYIHLASHGSDGWGFTNPRPSPDYKS